MKRHLFLIVFILYHSLLFSQSSGDEKAVKAVFKQMDDAWKVHDYAYTKYDIFDQNAVLINPIGMYFKNKDEITKSLQYLGEIRFKYLTSLKDTILNIRFLGPTVALVIQHSVHQFNEDMKLPDGSIGEHKGEISEGMQFITLVKKNSKWKVTSMQITHILSVPAQTNSK